jgi:hypothetical protein
MLVEPVPAETGLLAIAEDLVLGLIEHPRGMTEGPLQNALDPSFPNHATM